MQLQRGRIEGGEQLGEAIALLVELGLVVGRSPVCPGRRRKRAGLSHGYLACTGLSQGKDREGRSQPKGGDFKRPLRIVQVFCGQEVASRADNRSTTIGGRVMMQIDGMGAAQPKGVGIAPKSPQQTESKTADKGMRSP